MKVRDLKPIIDEYNQKRGFLSWLKNTPGMARLKALYNEQQPNKDISKEIKEVLKAHWYEIRNTKRSYLHPKLEATEFAYVRVAAFLDNQQQKEAKRPLGSHVCINTLMPPVREGRVAKGFQSFTKLVDFTEPRINIRGRILCYNEWLRNFKSEVKEINEQSVLNYLNKLFKLKNRTEQLRLLDFKDALLQIPSSTVDRITLRTIINAVNHLPRCFDCVNYNEEMTEIPISYFFKTKEKIGFDSRILFLNGFKNPVTGKSLHKEDLQKLMKHPHLGFSTYRFHTGNPLFTVETEDPDEIQLFQALQKKPDKQRSGLLSYLPTGLSLSSWLRESKEQKESATLSLLEKNWMKAPLPLDLRQTIYDRFCSLVELSFHMDDSFLNQISKELDDCFLNQISKKLKEPIHDMHSFKSLVSTARTYVLWSEMTNDDFFREAANVIVEVHKQMDNWEHATDNFFSAMREFALKPDHVLSYASGSYIRTNNEYLVRVSGLGTTEGAKKALKMLVDQFKTAFHIAYRYNKLPKLMECMTPNGVCIAEKMKHLVSIFGSVESAGPSVAKIEGSIHDVFASIMSKARQFEISRGATWSESDFFYHVVSRHSGNTMYLDDDKKGRLLDVDTIRKYMVDILGFDLGRPKPR